jgi:hypothetical protein
MLNNLHEKRKYTLPGRLEKLNHNHFLVKFLDETLNIDLYLHTSSLTGSEKVQTLLILEKINDEKIKNKWKNKKILKSNN